MTMNASVCLQIFAEIAEYRYSHLPSRRSIEILGESAPSTVAPAATGAPRGSFDLLEEGTAAGTLWTTTSGAKYIFPK